MIALLRYTDCLYDERIVFYTLAKNNVELIKTKRGSGITPTVFIEVKDLKELNTIIEDLNANSQYGVSLIKIKNRNVIDNLFRLFRLDKR